MENATKALLIAAAILIAIVLISLGVYVLNQGTTMVKDNSDMSDVEISTYNTKFEAYLGTNVSGSKLKQLVNTVNQHNKANKDDSSRVITIKTASSSGTTTITTDAKTGLVTATNIKSGSTYEIKAADSNGYTSGGLISIIEVTENP